MKLSQWAKNIGISYQAAWNMFKNKQLPGAYMLPTGTIILPNDIEERVKKLYEDKQDGANSK